MEAPAEGVELEVSTNVRIAFARKATRRNGMFLHFKCESLFLVEFWFKSVYKGGALEEVYIALCTQVGSG
jgi:hypothetical protein